jgi:hypothetical protein
MHMHSGALRNFIKKALPVLFTDGRGLAVLA